MKVGGASEIARSAQWRDYASFPDTCPQAEIEAAASNVLRYFFVTPGAFFAAQVVCQGRPES